MLATSSTRPLRPTGTLGAAGGEAPGVPCASMEPGQMQLTRMPAPPNSSARMRVSITAAALEVA